MPAANDAFTDALDLGSDSGSLVFDTTGSTFETGEPGGWYGYAGGSVWFTLTPTANGTLHVTTSATPAPRWDSFIQAWFGGPTLADLTTGPSDDDGELQPGITTADGYGTSGVDVPVVTGQPVYLQVISYDYVADGTNPSAGYPRDDCVLTWALTPNGITSFSPGGTVVGGTVDVYGSGFYAVTGATINGVAQSYAIYSDTHVRLTIASGTTTGYIHLTTAGDTLVSATQLAIGTAPTLSGLTSGGIAGNAALIGAPIVIDGTDCGSVTGVSFGGTVATPTAVTSTQVSVVVPAGITGLLDLQFVSAFGLSNAIDFQVLFPGPWVQPDDQWGFTYRRYAAVQSWGADFDHSYYPDPPTTAYPTPPDSSVAPLTVKNPAGVTAWHPSELSTRLGWVLTHRQDSAFVGHYEWRIDEWALSVDFGQQLGSTSAPSILQNILPPTSDWLDPPDAWYYEIEDDAVQGVTLGPIRVELNAPAAWEQDGPQDSPPYDLDPVLADGKMYVKRVTPADVVWTAPYGYDDQTLLELAPARWFDPADFDGTRVMEVPITVVTSGNTIGTSADADDTLLLEMTLDDLDVDGTYNVAAAVSLYVDDVKPTLPSPTQTDGGVQVISWRAVGTNEGLAQSPNAQGQVLYRPPRYRIVYTTPQGPTHAHTLRRRQQAAHVGSAPRRRQISNHAGSIRRGPGAAP